LNSRLWSSRNFEQNPVLEEIAAPELELQDKPVEAGAKRATRATPDPAEPL
jgi:hypothetical protein